MAEAVAGATIQLLLENLLKLSTELIREQIGLVWNFKDDLENLQKYFSMVNDVLHDAEKRQVTDRAVKRWLGELEALAFEADNVFDEISYRLLSKKVGAATKKDKVRSFFTSSSKNTIAYRLKMGRRIKDINEKLKSINRQASEFGLQTRIASAQAPVSGKDASGSTETDSFTADSVFIGRENDVSTIVEKLVTASQSEQKLSVLPIVGMGGLGKTTLARKVFNHEQIKSHFGDNCVWVHVPRTFDVSVLFERILTSMKIRDVAHGNREALLKMLQQYLGAKKYLLILDDVWNDNRLMWESFVDSLLGISSVTGNCMIVTTRNHETASIVKTIPDHELKVLSKDYCWSIIKAKALIRGDDPLEFEAIGMNIARKCKGLPLAAKVVGGLLRGKSKYEWMSIEKNWISDFGDNQNPMPNILKLSFDNLSSPSLKQCFAYCSIFPKGYEIYKEQLVWLWMAEGFLQTDHQRTNVNMEITGNKIFNLLLQNSLLQVASSDKYGNVTHCNMHDLVHDLAFSILHENDKVTNGIFHSRYIGYKSRGDGFLSIPIGHERYVRTLFFKGKISDIKFSEFESLRALTLESEEDIADLPASISKLKHLRYLNIWGTRIRSLSDSIAELYHLQTLRVGYFLEKLPDSLSFLISLRHLNIPSHIAWPEIRKLTSLQTLPYFYVDGERGREISELGNLNDLKGSLEIRNLEDVRDKNEAMGANLSQKPDIYELRLVWDTSRENVEANDDESVLEGLQPHSNLKILGICGFKGESLSLREELNNLVEIKLERCNELECLPDWLFSNNHNLKKLEITFCRKMTHLVRCLGGSRAPSPLRELRISGCRSLRELPDDLHSLYSLERLHIDDCPHLKSIPYYPITSRGGQRQRQRQQQGFTSLRELSIWNCEGLTNLPIEMVDSCAKSLEVLELIGLSSITNFPMVIGCLHRMTRLRKLVIARVPKFNFSSKDTIGSPLLQELSMGPFSDSSWNNVSFNQTVGAMLLQFTSLGTLTLYGMEHWDSLPDELQHLTSLESLTLRDFGIEALPEWFGNLSSLKMLELRYCKKLRHLPSKQAMQRLSKLTLLGINFCPLLLKEEDRSNINNIMERLQIDDSEWPKISHIPYVKVNFVLIPSDGH